MIDTNLYIPEEYKKNIPTLEEVKDYFKNSLVIKDCEGDTCNLNEIDERGIHLYDEEYFVFDINKGNVFAWSKDFGYSEILEYKTKHELKETEFSTISKSITDLLNYKNKKYGNSALNPVNIFQGKTKVGQRLDDKISRIKNSDSLNKNDVADLIGYLYLVCKEKEWYNFDEFKD